MADLAQVELALISLISGILYPNGPSQPSLTGSFTKIYRGWPLPTALEADLKAGKVNVSVFPQDNESKTTRYPQDWQVLAQASHGLILTATQNTLTVAGTPTPGNVGAVVDGKPYIYQVQPTDTVETIAQGLSSLIDPDQPSSVVQSTVTIPNARKIEVRAGGLGTIIRELRRIKRGFQVTIWTASPAQRDATASAIDNALAAIDYIPLPDGTGGRLLYERSHVEDKSQEENLYRRDLFYSVEYATTQTQTATEIILVDTIINSITTHITEPQ